MGETHRNPLNMGTDLHSATSSKKILYIRLVFVARYTESCMSEGQRVWEADHRVLSALCLLMVQSRRLLCQVSGVGVELVSCQRASH